MRLILRAALISLFFLQFIGCEMANYSQPSTETYVPSGISNVGWFKVGNGMKNPFELINEGQLTYRPDELMCFSALISGYPGARVTITAIDKADGSRKTLLDQLQPAGDKPLTTHNGNIIVPHITKATEVILRLDVGPGQAQREINVVWIPRD